MRHAAPLLLALVGCGPPDPVDVLDPFGLTPVPAEADPLAAHRPDDVACPPATWGPEGTGFEVQTGACNYGAFEQDLPMRLRRGDRLRISVWHDTLDAPEPALGHVAVLLDERVVWEDEVAIPAPSAALEAEVELEEPWEDARLGLHLHNHGFNSWRFVSVELRPR